MEFLPLAAVYIETEDVLRADALGPDFAIDVMAQSDEVELHALVVPLRGERIIFQFAGLRIEIAERALVHRVEPELALLVVFQREQADRSVGLEALDRIFGELEGLRIEFRDEHLAEVRVPDVTVLTEQHVL